MSAVRPITAPQLQELCHSPFRDLDTGLDVAAFVVEIDGSELLQIDVGSLPVIIVGVRRGGATAPDWCDVCLDEDALDRALTTIESAPIAAVALAVLLRGEVFRDVETGLAAESAVYSMLQAGPEFAGWLDRRERAVAAADVEEVPVLSTRGGEELHVELNRPHRHNAFSRAMRDALGETLTFALADDSITKVRLTGRGPSFCSGGDLAEFGSLPDPATAHRTRLARSPARLMHRLASRVEVHLHGACMGAGIELAAFAGTVLADGTAQISLPETALGLVPGAGGTTSIPRRVGRQRTLELALTGPIDAATALEWGLVDRVERSR